MCADTLSLQTFLSSHSKILVLTLNFNFLHWACICISSLFEHTKNEFTHYFLYLFLIKSPNINFYESGITAVYGKRNFFKNLYSKFKAVPYTIVFLCNFRAWIYSLFRFYNSFMSSRKRTVKSCWALLFHFQSMVNRVCPYWTNLMSLPKPRYSLFPILIFPWRIYWYRLRQSRKK